MSTLTDAERGGVEMDAEMREELRATLALAIEMEERGEMELAALVKESAVRLIDRIASNAPLTP